MRARRLLALVLAFVLGVVPATATNAMDYIHLARTDLYGALEVQRDANATIITKSYRRLALMYHPDKFPPGSDERAKRAAAQRFRVMAEAKTTLLDPERRAEYDALIDSLPEFARPKFGKKSFADREIAKFPAWAVVMLFAWFCVAFVSVAQYTSRASDKESLMNSAFFAQKLRSRNKNAPNGEKVSAAAYFEEFLIEHGLVDLTGWEHTLGGRLWARARGRSAAALSGAPREDAAGSEAVYSSASEETSSATGTPNTVLKRRGKKKGKSKPVMSTQARQAEALRRLRGELEARRAYFGETYDED